MIVRRVYPSCFSVLCPPSQHSFLRKQSSAETNFAFHVAKSPPAEIRSEFNVEFCTLKALNSQRLENRGYFALSFTSATGNIPHATDHRCIFHGLYLPLDKEGARGQVIIHRADLHQNIPCLLLTTAGHAKVHLL